MKRQWSGAAWTGRLAAALAWGEECFPVERPSDGLECGHALAAAGFDNGPYVGEKVRPPVGAETVDDLEKDFREP